MIEGFNDSPPSSEDVNSEEELPREGSPDELDTGRSHRLFNGHSNSRKLPGGIQDESQSNAIKKDSQGKGQGGEALENTEPELPKDQADIPSFLPSRAKVGSSIIPFKANTAVSLSSLPGQTSAQDVYSSSDDSESNTGSYSILKTETSYAQNSKDNNGAPVYLVNNNSSKDAHDFLPHSQSQTDADESARDESGAILEIENLVRSLEMDETDTLEPNTNSDIQCDKTDIVIAKNTRSPNIPIQSHEDRPVLQATHVTKGTYKGPMKTVETGDIDFSQQKKRFEALRRKFNEPGHFNTDEDSDNDSDKLEVEYKIPQDNIARVEVPLQSHGNEDRYVPGKYSHSANRPQLQTGKSLKYLISITSRISSLGNRIGPFCLCVCECVWGCGRGGYGTYIVWNHMASWCDLM